MAALSGVNVDRTISLTFVHGRGARRRRGPALPALLRGDRFLHRLRRRHQGVHRGGVRRHRLAARRHARRPRHRPDRDLLVGLFHHRIQGRGGVLDARHRAHLLPDRACSAVPKSRRFERLGASPANRSSQPAPGRARRRHHRGVYRLRPVLPDARRAAPSTRVTGSRSAPPAAARHRRRHRLRRQARPQSLLVEPQLAAAAAPLGARPGPIPARQVATATHYGGALLLVIAAAPVSNRRLRPRQDAPSRTCRSAICSTSRSSCSPT